MQTMNWHDSKTIHDTVRTSAATLLTHAPRSLSFLRSKGLDDNDASVAKNMMIMARCWTKILILKGFQYTVMFIKHARDWFRKTTHANFLQV